MIKNISQIQIECNDRCYQFLCSCDSPLVEVHEVLSSMMKLIVEKLNEAQSQQEVRDDGRDEPCSMCSESSV